MAVSPDGRTVAAGGYSGNVKLAAEGAPVTGVSSDIETEQMLLGLDFSPDQRLLAIAGQALDRRSGAAFVILRDLASGERRVLPDYGNASRVRFSPDGRWLAIGGDGGEFALHPLRPGDGKPPELKLTRAGTVVAIAFADGGKSALRRLVVRPHRRAEHGDRRSHVHAAVADHGLIEGMSVAPDGNVVVTHACRRQRAALGLAALRQRLDVARDLSPRGRAAGRRIARRRQPRRDGRQRRPARGRARPAPRGAATAAVAVDGRYPAGLARCRAGPRRHRHAAGAALD